MPILPPIPAEGPPTLGIVDEDGLITAKRRTRGFCPRHAFLINEDDRTVQCKRCQKTFEPLEALLYLASWPDRWRAEVTRLNQQIKAKTAVLDELARKLTNYKAAARKRGVAVPSEWDALRSVPASAPPKETT